MKQLFEVQSTQEKKTISNERKQEIVDKFKKSVGTLSEKEIADLDTLPIREIFSLLSSWEHAALLYLHRFPRKETIDLILELSEQEKFKSFSEKKVIAWVMGLFLHQPETFDKAVEVLKNKKDPRVIFETERGTIEMADNVEIAKEICLMDEDLEKNRVNFENYIKKGDLFSYRDKNKKLVCFAIANQMDNYILYVNYLHTATNQRKKGYGEEMLKYLVANHEGIETHLIRESSHGMLSEKVLKKLGFRKEEKTNKWVHRYSTQSSLTTKN
ncbi:MAG: hypothetical protein WAV31_02585 [Candidatus Moraniibacteriota bacterium]